MRGHETKEMSELIEALRTVAKEMGEDVPPPRPVKRCCGGDRDVIRYIAKRSGLSEATILEAMHCDSECKKKFTDENGSFKGGKGEAFDNCVKMFKECCSGVDDPEALCASIGRKAGKI